MVKNMKSENFTLKNFIQLENGMYFLHASFSMKDRLFSLVLNDSKEGIHVIQIGKEQYECFCYTKLDEKEIADNILHFLVNGLKRKEVEKDAE